jgi:lysophospholipase L1-like esterase
VGASPDSYYLHGSCLQSSNGYPALLDAKGRIDLQDNATCPGFTTTDVAKNLPSGLDEHTRLVTLTVGGNDLHFRDTLETCTLAQIDPRERTACKNAIDIEVTPNLQTLSDNLTNLYAKIAAAAPEARIIVTGYPILFDAERRSEFSEDVINPVNDATTRLNKTIEDAVAAANDDGNIDYVDVTEEFAKDGVVKLINDPYAKKPADPDAFIHSPFLCALTTTDPATDPCRDPAAYHPTDKGYSAYADAISAALPGGWLNKQLSA